MTEQADRRKEYLERCGRLATEDKVRICNAMCYIMDCKRDGIMPDTEFMRYILYGDY
ncbi:MAG: hypothetical protein FWG72_08230 [Oscillospiraceae bacterium]|nr:hypothetical protein [Oscillospiraceae bacterium]